MELMQLCCCVMLVVLEAANRKNELISHGIDKPLRYYATMSRQIVFNYRIGFHYFSLPQNKAMHSIEATKKNIFPELPLNVSHWVFSKWKLKSCNGYEVKVILCRLLCNKNPRNYARNPIKPAICKINSPLDVVTKSVQNIADRGCSSWYIFFLQYWYFFL